MESFLLMMSRESVCQSFGVRQDRQVIAGIFQDYAMLIRP
jgi:hypothetical protein